MAPIKHSRPDYDLGFQVKICQHFQVVPALLGSGLVGRLLGHIIGQVLTLNPSRQAHANSYALEGAATGERGRASPVSVRESAAQTNAEAQTNDLEARTRWDAAAQTDAPAAHAGRDASVEAHSARRGEAAQTQTDGGDAARRGGGSIAARGGVVAETQTDGHRSQAAETQTDDAGQEEVPGVGWEAGAVGEGGGAPPAPCVSPPPAVCMWGCADDGGGTVVYVHGAWVDGRAKGDWPEDEDEVVRMVCEAVRCLTRGRTHPTAAVPPSRLLH